MTDARRSSKQFGLPIGCILHAIEANRDEFVENIHRSELRERPVQNLGRDENRIPDRAERRCVREIEAF